MTKLWQFWQGRQKPPFSEKVQRGTKGNFSKIAQKDALAEKAQKQTVAKNSERFCNYMYIVGKVSLIHFV